MPARLAASIFDPVATATPPDAVASEADHRVANSLSIVAGLVRAQAAKLPAEPTVATGAIRAQLQELSIRIEAVGRVHRLLMRDHGRSTIELAAYLRAIAEAASASLTSAERTRMSFDLSSCAISPKQAVAIGLLVGEAITNAVKYAHPGGISGTIQVANRCDDRRALIVEVEDDGVGLPSGVNPRTAASSGFRLMHALAEQLQGQLAFERRSIGLTVRLEIPPGINR